MRPTPDPRPSLRALLGALDEVDAYARTRDIARAELREDLEALDLVDDLDHRAAAEVLARGRQVQTETLLNADRDLVIRAYLAEQWPWWRCLRVAGRLVRLAWPWGRVWPPGG